MDGVPIERVKEFKYLDRILADDHSDAPCVNRNVNRARSTWSRISRLLSSEAPQGDGNALQKGRPISSTLQFRAMYLTPKTMRKLQNFHRHYERFGTGSTSDRSQTNTTEHHCSRISGTMANPRIHATPRINCHAFRFRAIHIPAMLGTSRRR